MYIFDFSDDDNAAEYREVDGPRAVVGVEPGGELRCEERELDEGEVIAHGTIDDDGYGSTPVERAHFIVDTVRVHLAQTSCTLHTEDLSSIAALLRRPLVPGLRCADRLGGVCSLQYVRRHTGRC
ncbi:hypothetical protein MBRA_08730 [Mycobacterium branderi]|nr:hypothetical protein MBRA_08730 [Mycobacterium branderi]